MNAIVSLLCVAGGALGMLLVATLLTQKNRSQTNLLLACLIAVACVDLLFSAMARQSRSLTEFELLRLSGYPGLLYAPLLYLYFKSQTSASQLRMSAAWHFSGFVVLQSIALIEFAAPGALPWLTIQTCMNLACLPIISAYAITSVRVLIRNAPPRRPCTVFHDCMVAVMALMAALASYLVEAGSAVLTSQFDAGIEYGTDMLLSCSLTILTYSALHRTVSREHEGHSHQVINFAEAKPESEKEKYGNNRLPEFVRETIINELNQYMQTSQPWLKVDLTLGQLATDINVNPHHLSQIINSEFGKSFACYINEYRVNAACRLLCGDTERTVLEIAMDSGFSSKSSFNALFKRHTGLTPSEYRKKFQNSSYRVA